MIDPDFERLTQVDGPELDGTRIPSWFEENIWMQTEQPNREAQIVIGCGGSAVILALRTGPVYGSL